jgi:hypothetical protein
VFDTLFGSLPMSVGNETPTILNFITNIVGIPNITMEKLYPKKNDNNQFRLSYPD